MKANTAHTPQAPQDEALLIRRILDGQTELFRQLVVRYAEPVLRVVGRVVPSPEDAEEVVQDTLLAAFRSLDRYDALRASFHTWLMAIAYHTAMNRIRREHRLSFADTDQASLDAIPDAEADALLSDSRQERLALLDRAVALLQPDDQLLLSLYYYDDRPIGDIALITDRSEGYLRSRLQWIRKRLALTIKTLETHDEE